MTVDLSKLILYTPDNAFKNVNKYSGSVVFPTSATAGQTVTVTTTVSLTDVPIYTDYFAQFVELEDAITGGSSKLWYSGNEAGNFGIGIHVSAPVGNVGWLGCGVYPVINGTTLTMTGTFINPYSNSITLDALTVPFVFVEYTLAS